MSAAEDAVRVAEACVVHPGDVLVLKYERAMTREEFELALATIKAGLPKTVKFLVVDGSFQLHVLRTGEVAE